MPTRRVWAAALTVAACVLPSTFAEGAISPPAHSWRAQYPDRVIRQTYKAAQQPTLSWSSTFTAGTTVVQNGWWPTYPAQVFQKKILTAQRQSVFYRQDAPAGPLDPGGGFISTGAVPLLQYQALAAPFNEIVVSAFDTQIATVGADGVLSRPSTHASRQQFYAADKFTAPTAVVLPDLSWAATYPDQLRRIRQTPLIASELYPTIAPQLDLYWRPQYPNQHLVRPNVARFVWSHPHFIVEVDVPVMSWTGLYLDPPVRLKARRQPIGTSGPLEPTLLSQLTPPTDIGWQGRYPDRIDPRRRPAFAHSEPVQPWFVPELFSPVTALSWQGRYADRVPGRRRAAEYRAFSFDRFTAPTPVVVPDQTVAVYPNRVYAKARPTWAPDETWPDFVPDVNQPVTPLSWDAQYPDRIWPQTSLLTAAQLALMIDARIAPPVIAATPAVGRNRVGIPRRNRTGTVNGYQRTVFIAREKRGR